MRGLARRLRTLVRLSCIGAALFLPGVAAATPATDAIHSDPPADAAFPARLAVVHIPTHGVSINGVFYLAPGAGPHPTMVIFHGLPGNEQNLDLAQALRRTGWNVLTLHYRGSWGSPGAYSYAHLVEDGVAVVAFVQAAETARAYRIDVNRIVLAGHSTGGFVAVNAAARMQGIRGLVLISGTDDAWEARVARKNPASWRKFIQDNYSDSLAALAGCSAEGLGRELLSHGANWTFATSAPKIATIPLLVVTSNDGFAPDGEALATVMRGIGASPTVIHMATDHAYSDHRIELERTIVEWLRSNGPR